MEDYKNKYENLLHDIDIAIAGQKEGETKIVLQNLKERHTESEDERIRKWLIEIVEEVRKANPTNAEHNGNCSEALAWLEKQGEKPNVWSEDDDDNMIMIEDRLSDYLDYIRKDSTLTKHQKYFLKENVIGYVNWLKSLKERMKGE